MRVAFTSSVSRRALGALAAAALTSSRLPAHAIVEGIPLYAPGENIMLPDAGFETFLPRIEALRDVTLPTLKLAISEAEWAAAKQLTSADSIKAQLKTFGGTASVMGDEAYTVLQLKARYAAAAKRLQQVLDAQNAGDAQLLVKEMETTVVELYALIPKVVIDQVRRREDILARKIAAEAGGQPSAVSEPEPVPSSVPTAPGMLNPYDAGKKRCGIDIRC